MLSGSSATIASIARHVVQCAQLDSNDAHILIEDNVGEATLRAVPAFKRSPPHAIPIGYRDKVYRYRKSKHRMKRGDRCKKGIDAKSIAIVTAQRGLNGISHSDKDNDLN